MRPGEARLAVDCGSTTTVAVVAWPDGRWMPLEFDGSPVLPSAVLVQPDGDLLTGQRAWQAAATQPDRFLAAPLRAGAQSVSVGGAEVEVLDLVAATLRRVAGEAERLAGDRITDVRLVVPAGWGPRRRTWLRQAAYRAGMGQPVLVEAPVAAAEQLLATGVQLPVGSFLVVCDIGGGFEVTVLRRGPAGFEVLSTLADAKAGGAGIDEALTATLLDGDAGRLSEADGVRWAVAASVRTAKETLSQVAAVSVPMPAGPAVVANGTLVEQAAGPVLRRAAQLTVEAIAAAEIGVEQVSGAYCIGGGASMPLAARMLGEQAGVTPVVVTEPGLAAVRGAAQATGLAGEAEVAAEPVVPPVRRAVGVAVPGLASLGLLTQFMFTANWSNGSRVLRGPGFYVIATWGELAMAAVFAVMACLSAGTVLGSVIAARDRNTGARPASGQVGTGILAAVSLGMTIAGLYAVIGSLYFGLELGPFLRWALLPVAPVAALAAVTAVVAARGWRTPRQGWDQVLAFPLGSVVAAAAGMGLVQYSLSAQRWPELVFWIDLAGIVGGLLLGVGVVIAAVSPLVLRLILGTPLAVLTAASVSWQAAGVLGVAYCLAVGLWWARQVWQLAGSPVRKLVHAS